jgi:hypothetical protein
LTQTLSHTDIERALKERLREIERLDWAGQPEKNRMRRSAFDQADKLREIASAQLAATRRSRS